jgi:hypothetical protein
VFGAELAFDIGENLFYLLSYLKSIHFYNYCEYHCCKIGKYSAKLGLHRTACGTMKFAIKMQTVYHYK